MMHLVLWDAQLPRVIGFLSLELDFSDTRTHDVARGVKRSRRVHIGRRVVEPAFRS